MDEHEVRLDLGSSAHAEMRPRLRLGCLRRGRFLRSRGDAPVEAAHEGGDRGVPPLTRRCARSCDCGARTRAGSSAHAEMRRPQGGPGAASSRFLRSRGDAPRDDEIAPEGREVPPLTRRCAPLRGPCPPSAHGSSAHAEMRPTRRSPVAARAGFLRSRGDAPEDGTGHALEERVPPLTRRCARPRARGCAHRPGSSAHAEMRPAVSVFTTPRKRFLRSRGDAPPANERIERWKPVPPLTRRCARLPASPRP